MTSGSVTAILYNKVDALAFLKYRPNADVIYPLTPDAKAEIIDTGLPILDHTEFFSDNGHRKILKHVKHLENTFFPNIEKQKLTEASKETCKTFFHNLLCTKLYLWYSIQDIIPACVFNGKRWIILSDINKIYNILFKQITLERNGIFTFMNIKKPTFMMALLNKLLN